MKPSHLPRRVKAWLRNRHPQLHHLAQNLYWAATRDGTYCFIARFARNTRDVFFLQIGAHDGKTDDKLHRLVRAHGWHGVLLEPVTSAYQSLVRNYEGISGLTFENKALAEVDGIREFYRIDERARSLPHWADQLGSFNRDVITRHREQIPDIENYIIEESVACISWETLIRTHSISQIDLILIDTEGYDLTILRQIDFRRFSPRLVIYEQKHLTANDKTAARELLYSHGYVLHSVGGDDVAIREY
jgi:FkbM family methyltransferase